MRAAVLIAIALAEAEQGTLSSGGALELVVEEVGYGLLAGGTAGAVGALALRASWDRKSIEPQWAQILAAATALLAAGVASGLGGSIFIAAFSAGFVFGALRRAPAGELTYLVDEGGELFNAVTFVVFGAVILGPVLDELSWALALYALMSLTLVRMLPVALAMLGTGARISTAAFLGWFGPRGLASIVFGVILLEEAGLPRERLLLLAVAVTVGLSVYAHGLTAGPLTSRYLQGLENQPSPDSGDDRRTRRA